jgi:hypothetical protein
MATRSESTDTHIDTHIHTQQPRGVNLRTHTERGWVSVLVLGRNLQRLDLDLTGLLVVIERVRRIQRRRGNLNGIVCFGEAGVRMRYTPPHPAPPYPKPPHHTPPKLHHHTPGITEWGGLGWKLGVGIGWEGWRGGGFQRSRGWLE